ncbi:MAG TPA: cardiolipin synthase B [Gammaproteobacteria bacterium]|nr:cardiolipin synthase B [Gammaproteobacteria bacterium]
MSRSASFRRRCRGCVPRVEPGHEPFRLYTEGDELYADMLRSIAGARQRIRMESYIFAPDELGWRFARALARRGEEGLQVRVLMDAAGSLFWRAPELARYLRAHGVKVRWFHRWSWRRPLRYNRRDHRKLLAIDEDHFYLGGFNIHRENSLELYGEQRWRDTHVRLEGELTRHANRLFDRFWKGRKRWMPPRRRRANVLLTNHSGRCRHALQCLYMEIFHRARSRIYVTTPYFVPDHRTQHTLMEAARRGVDVRLLVPRKSDVTLTRWAAQAAYAGLLREGVRIFEYQPRILHAKTAVADGDWATLGTANLDYRSFFLNYELNLVSRDPGLCRGLEAQFLRDLEASVEIMPVEWAQRHWGRHLLEMIGWLARRWL